MMSDTMRSATLPFVVLLVLCGCGERPQRVGKGGSSSPPSATSSASSSGDSKTAKAARFSGNILLEGGMAAVQNGAIFVSARRKGQRLPTLSHKYELNDPSWSTQDGNRVLTFTLTDDDNMAGFGAPMGAEMEVEARYAPSGFIDPSPTADNEGVIRATVPAAPGDAKLAIKLQTTSGK
jgi:hypothetical protein